MMRDLSREIEASLAGEAARRRGRRVVAFMVVAGVVLAWVGLAGFDRAPATCAACRMDRFTFTWYGLRWTSEQDTNCSRWYASHVEPTHAHAWARKTRCRSFGIPGLYGGYSCSIGGPLTMLGPDTQREIYQHFEDPLEAKQLFLRLGEQGQGSYDTMSALIRWSSGGYPGSWNDWRKDHPAEIE